jgi:hypothetical protein
VAIATLKDLQMLLRSSFVVVSRLTQGLADGDALKTAAAPGMYLDKASGAKGTARPGLAAALDHMRRGGTLVVLDLIRLGSDTRELLAIVEDDLHARGCHLGTLSRWTLSRALGTAAVTRRRRVSTFDAADSLSSRARIAARHDAFSAR